MVLSSTTKDIMEDGINNQEAFEDMNKEELINLVLSMKAEKDNTSEGYGPSRASAGGGRIKIEESKNGSLRTLEEEVQFLESVDEDTRFNLLNHKQMKITISAIPCKANSFKEFMDFEHRVRGHLGSYGLEGILDGTVSLGEENQEEKESFLLRNNKVVTFLRESLQSKQNVNRISSLTLRSPSARYIWCKLSESFCGTEAINERKMLEEYDNMRYEDYSNGREYLTALEDMEIAIERGGKTKFSESQKKNKMLTGISENIRTTVKNLDAATGGMDLIRQRKMVQELILVEEEAKKNKHKNKKGGSGGGNEKGLKTSDARDGRGGGGRGGWRGRGGYRGGRGGRGQDAIQCRTCKKMGHMARDCELTVCSGCGKQGHIMRNCADTVCYNCNGKGHLSTNCPGGVEEQKQAPPRSSLAKVEFALRTTIKWTMDSGASQHMVGDDQVQESDFTEYREREGGRVHTSEAGSSLPIKGEGELGSQSDVLLVEGLSEPLLSIAHVTDERKVVVLNSKSALIYREDDFPPIPSEPVATGYREGNLYYLEEKVYEEEAHLTQQQGSSSSRAAAGETVELWHRRLDHASYPVVKKMLSEGGIAGTKVAEAELKAKPPEVCETCLQGGMQRKPFPTSKNKPEDFEPGEQLHMDFEGPFKPRGHRGEKWSLEIRDRSTGLQQSYPLRSRKYAEAKELGVDDYINRHVSAHGHEVKRIRVDGEGCFSSKKFKRWARKAKIGVEYTTRATSQSNGRAECGIKIAARRGRSALIGSGLSSKWWPHARRHGSYVMQRTYTTSNRTGRTPIEEMTGKVPDCSHIRELGAPLQYLVPKSQRTRLEPRTKPGKLLGFSPDHAAYEVLCTETNTIRTVRYADVVFTGGSPTSDLPPSPNHPASAEGDESMSISDQRGGETGSGGEEEDEDSGTIRGGGGDYSDSDSDSDSDSSTDSGDGDKEDEGGGGSGDEDGDGSESGSGDENDGGGSEGGSEADDSGEEDGGGEKEESGGRNDSGGRPRRVRKPTTVVRDILSGEASGSLAGVGHQANMSLVDNDPGDYEEAMSRPPEEANQWRAAILRELASHEESGTTELVDKGEAMRRVADGSATILEPRWAFKTKRGKEGEVLKHKARLNAADFKRKGRFGGNEQPEDTFAPVARKESIRLVAGIASVYGLKIKHLDVTTAFLYPEIGDRLVYLHVPKGMDAPPNTVLRLKKCIYGLQVSGKKFNDKFNGDLLALGYTRCESDPCVYVRESEEGELSYLVLTVDDLQVVVKEEREYERTRDRLMETYKMTDMGELDFYAGIKMEQNEGSITLSQEAYTQKLLEQYNMSGCKPVPTPAVVGNKLSREEEPATEEEKREMQEVPYRRAVGGLLYLSVCTRPDIEQSVNTVSKFCNNPGKKHWEAVKRILRYLKGTPDYGIRYTREGNEDGWLLVCYVDADFAACLDTRRSRTGFVLFYAGAPVCWGTRGQGAVSTSTAEAEYVALSTSSNDVKWIRQLLGELKVGHSVPTVMYGDNSAANLFVTQPTSIKRCKHIDIKYHHVREKQQWGEIDVRKVESEANTADVFTKPLGEVAFRRHRDRLVVKLGE